MATEPPDPADIARAAGLPEGWTVTTYAELVPAPLDPGMKPHSNFARNSTIVRDSVEGYISASGDQQDAINQALSYCQATMQPYVRAEWPHA